MIPKREDVLMDSRMGPAIKIHPITRRKYEIYRYSGISKTRLYTKRY